ncbi:MAG: PIN domain-containing protein [Limisphaerales bacterium]
MRSEARLARYFLDTNVFVYCFDRADRRKQQRAERLVRDSLAGHLGVVSSQVIQEFLNVATRRFAQPMTAGECREYLETVLEPLCEVFPSFSLFHQALALRDETGFSFYDCLILAAALEGNCGVLYSEDLHAGQVVRGLKIENPFAGLEPTA